MKYFDIWNTSTANVVADADSEEDLLAVVREMAKTEGHWVIEEWALGWGDDEDEKAGGIIAHGKVLLERAFSDSSTAS